MNIPTSGTGFHGLLDAEIDPFRIRAMGGVESKNLVVQGRDVSYRFQLHQHPYVRELTRRLIREGVSGLQAADTDYEPGGASVPFSVEIALGTAADATLHGGSGITLLGEVQAISSGNTAITLPANLRVRTVKSVAVTLPDETRLTLIEGMTDTPAEREPFTLRDQAQAVSYRDTKIILDAPTPIALYDGTEATIPSGHEVVLAQGSEVTLEAGTPARLLKSKPLPTLFREVFSALQYEPSALVQRPYPVQDLDFTTGGAYGVYNWELFFHVPLTIAIHLSRNQRFAEAQQWLHFIFDPTDDSDGPTPERFWRVRPIQYTDVRKAEDILVNLSTNADPALREETVRSIEAWRNAPFRPHVVARFRQQAYMYRTVMAFLDNLIAWGDSLFRQDTGEAIDEALQLYVLAANLLGPRPQAVPKKGSVRRQTYASLRADLDRLGNALREMEGDVGFDVMPFPADGGGEDERFPVLGSLGRTLYFCVPRNEKLLGYWDTVADRLFKIRNSLTIEGAFRQLPLFEPPIDPALLARAAAAGIDVGAIVNGLNQPLPLVRFQLLVQKATEIAQEVKALGNNLLSAMEKEDGEALSILRARHERAVMEMVEQVRYGQLQEAIKSRESLLESLSLAVQRYTYYERQLGRQTEEIEKAVPELAELDRDGLAKMKLVSREQPVGMREIEVDIAHDLGGPGGTMISFYEVEELDRLDTAKEQRSLAAWVHRIGAGFAYFPEIETNLHPFGTGSSMSFGGSHLANAERFVASVWEASADHHTHKANKARMIGSYARRAQDWAFQSNLAAGEITQIFKQLRAAQIREAVAELELKNHRRQRKHAEEVERFLNEEGTERTGKKTNKALYAWMKREVKGLFGQCFQLAFDIARKAERALQHELGNPELSYLQFGYLAGKAGLLAGEKLHLDIKRMEMAYHELNQREYELTKHVSLLQLDPLALLQLRTTGRCTVRLPATLFDMDGPGHYFRRIKTVALSIPCVTGPYVSVNCKLTLLRSSIRRSPLIGDGYSRTGPDDDRFQDYFGSIQSIVTSSGQNDSGVFDPNLRDERYLPFENSGVESEWRLELPANPAAGDPQQFDYGTISDVVLHVRYTARDGGTSLRTAALGHLEQAIGQAEAAGSVRLFSVRHEFPNEWARFKGVELGDSAATAELTLGLRQEHYPFWSADRLQEVRRADLYAHTEKTSLAVSDGDGNEDILTSSPFGKLRGGELEKVRPQAPVGRFSLRLNDNSMKDLWLVVAWGR
jgi:hypothetical protein